MRYWLTTHSLHSALTSRAGTPQNVCGTAALGLFLSLMTAPVTYGHLTLISATRSVYAEQYGYYPNVRDSRSTTDFGTWEEAVEFRYAGARQTSSISPDGIDFVSRTYASGGAGHHSYSRSVLNVTFDVDSPVAWSVAYEWQTIPGASGQYDNFLRLSGSDVNLFAGADWLNGHNPRVAGFLDPGRYELRFLDGHGDSAYIFNEHFSFSVTVPNASTLMVILGVPTLLRQRRR